jgi:hypothetical protein
MAIVKPVHAASFSKCVDGQWRQFNTLCGLRVVDGTNEAMTESDVTCKSCRRSRGWAAMVATLPGNRKV